MSDATTDGRARRRPHTPPMTAPFLEFDLNREVELLHSEPAWTDGQNARTLVKFDDFRIVLMALRARARVPGHRTKGRISIHTTIGHIVVRAEGRTFDLPAGGLIVLDRDLPHEVEALEDSAFVLTIAWPA